VGIQKQKKLKTWIHKITNSTKKSMKGLNIYGNIHRFFFQHTMIRNPRPSLKGLKNPHIQSQGALCNVAGTDVFN